MSKKQKLESLQQLGILKAKDVKQMQTALGKPQVVRTHISAASIRWGSLALVVTAAYGSLAAVIVLAWKLSH
jgi:hypothetical protein